MSPTRATRLPAATVRRIRALAGQSTSVELIAREVGVSRYRVERVLDAAPAGRNDVPYRYRDLHAEVVTRYRSGEAAERIARALGISLTATFDYLRRAGVALRGKTAPHPATYADVLTAAYLAAEYVDTGRSASDIAEEVGCSESTVHNWLRRHGIARRRVEVRRHAYEFRDDMLDAVAEGCLSAESAAARVGCSRSELLRALRRSGRDLPSERKTPLTRDLLLALYVDERLTCLQIAQRTGWGVNYVRQALRRHGIAVRPGPHPGSPGRWHPRRNPR